MARNQNSEEYNDRLTEDARLNRIVGKNLNKARTGSKTPGGHPVTFEWLAKVTTLHNGSIRRFEKGESGMTVATLARLKEALDCSWDALLYGCESTIVKTRKKHIKN